MFGVYRTVLALCVMLTHLVAVSGVGAFALHGFFLLSGYLMTLILQETYGYSRMGIWRYVQNRVLRLYPIYFFILAISLWIVWVYPEEMRAYRGLIRMPEDWSGWVQNVTMVYWDVFPHTVKPRLSPPTWALTNELFYYALIALGVSRTRGMTMLWLGVGVGYHVWTFAAGLDHTYRYHALWAASLPFSIGAMLYHTREQWRPWVEGMRKHAVAWMWGVWALNAVLFWILRWLEQDVYWSYTYVPYYLNYGINGMMVMVLSVRGISGMSKRMDRRIGDFSYPLYLVHWQAGFLASMCLYGVGVFGKSQQGILCFPLTLLFSVGIAYLGGRFIEQPVERLRDRVRARAKR